MKPRVLLAFAATFSNCLFLVGSDDSCYPQVGGWVNSNVTQGLAFDGRILVSEYGFPFSGDMHYVALWGIERHPPKCFPFMWDIRVLLELITISVGFHLSTVYCSVTTLYRHLRIADIWPRIWHWHALACRWWKLGPLIVINGPRWKLGRGLVPVHCPGPVPYTPILSCILASITICLLLKVINLLHKIS